MILEDIGIYADDVCAHTLSVDEAQLDDLAIIRNEVLGGQM